MKLFQRYEKLVRKIKRINLGLLLLGKLFIVFSLGSIFWLSLGRYQPFILLLSTLFLVCYFNNNFMNWYKKKKIGLISHAIGFIGMLLLALLLGLQFPEMRFRIPVLIVGIILVLQALYDLFRKK